SASLVDEQAPDAAAIDLSGVFAVIPALNEEVSLPLVLQDLPAVARVIVVDNGSTDRTANLATAGGALVVREPQRGYGASCLKGLATIEELYDDGQPAPQVVVFLDADYSDDPTELTKLVQPVLAGNADFVLGSRLRGRREAGAMPPQSV